MFLVTYQALTAANVKMTVFCDIAPSSLVKLTDVSEVFTDSIIRTIRALIMETVCTSETSVNFYETTRHNIPEDYYHLQSVASSLKLSVEFSFTLYGSNPCSA
jgi:hypothetical protein